MKILNMAFLLSFWQYVYEYQFNDVLKHSLLVLLLYVDLLFIIALYV